MIDVIGMTEVLLARIVSGRTCGSISANNLLLERQIFQHRLDDIVGTADGLGEIGLRRDAVHGALVVAEVLEIGEDARLHGLERRRKGVIDGDVMAGEREHLRDAVAHQAGADDGDARFAHVQPAV